MWCQNCWSPPYNLSGGSGIKLWLHEFAPDAALYPRRTWRRKKEGERRIFVRFTCKSFKKNVGGAKKKKERKIRLQVLHMKILFYITGMILVFQENEFCDERFFENGTKYFCIHRCVSSNWNLWGNRIVIRICMNNFYYFEYFMLFLMI